MMLAMGHEASALAVARMYADVAGAFVLDSRDADLASQVEALGYRTVVCDTVMKDGGGGLAAAILAAAPVS
jgi:LPPG:FO 2-phospho-L-lactate transferase